MIIQAEISEILQAAKHIEKFPKIFERAKKYALSRAKRAMQSTAVKETAKEYYVSANLVRRSIQVWERQSLITLQVRGRRMLIHNYKLTPQKPTKKKYYLKGAVRRSGGLKPLGNDTFLFPTKGGNYIAMQRLGRERLPISPIVSPAIPQLIEKNPELIEEIKTVGMTEFASEFNRQGMRLLGVIV